MSRTDFPEQPRQRPDTPRTYVNIEFDPDPPPRRRVRGGRVAGVVAAVLGLGLAGGVLMMPMLEDREPAPTILPPQADVPTPDDGLDIIVDDAPPPPVEPAALEPDVAPLETGTPSAEQPPEPPPAPQAAAPEPSPPAPSPPPQPAQVASAPPPSPPAAPVAIPPPAPRVVQGATVRPDSPVQPQAALQPTRTARPSFNCRYARTVSERMVCADPRLAAADRRLARAYHRAIASGVPERELRRQQDIWLGAREYAAASGPADVARAYEARILELQAMAR